MDDPQGDPRTFSREQVGEITRKVLNDLISSSDYINWMMRQKDFVQINWEASDVRREPGDLLEYWTEQMDKALAFFAQRTEAWKAQLGGAGPPVLAPHSPAKMQSVRLSARGSPNASPQVPGVCARSLTSALQRVAGPGLIIGTAIAQTGPAFPSAQGSPTVSGPSSTMAGRARSPSGSGSSRVSSRHSVGGGSGGGTGFATAQSGSDVSDTEAQLEKIRKMGQPKKLSVAPPTIEETPVKISVSKRTR